MTRASISSGQQLQAVVLVPPGETVDTKFAHKIWTHCRARGYELVALLRDWPSADRMLGSGEANIVVMPGAEHGATIAARDNSETVRLWPAAQAAAAEPWRDHGAPRRRAAVNGRFISGRLPRERVRELLDGPGEVTAPVGLDPETIAAARRIARRLGRPSL